MDKQIAHYFISKYSALWFFGAGNKWNLLFKRVWTIKSKQL